MNYPEFRDENIEELCLLLKFRNMLKIALQVIPGENHKNCLLRIAARLEGSCKEYITGGGSKPAVRRRELVFSRESGINPVKRPEGSRKKPQRNVDGSSGGGGKVKTSLSSFSMKKVRLVRLASADMKVLGKPMDLFAPAPSSSSSSSIRPLTKTPPVISSTQAAHHQHALPHQPPHHPSSSSSSAAAFDWNSCNASIDIFQYGSPQARDMNHHHQYPHQYHDQYYHQPYQPQHHHQHHQHYDNNNNNNNINHNYTCDIPARPVGGFKRALSSSSSPSWIDLPPRQESFHSIDLQGLTGLTELLGFEATTTAASSSLSYLLSSHHL
jgi:hypothetical protein